MSEPDHRIKAVKASAQVDTLTTILTTILNFLQSIDPEKVLKYVGYVVKVVSFLLTVLSTMAGFLPPAFPAAPNDKPNPAPADTPPGDHPATS
jgi:hypothetical protein